MSFSIEENARKFPRGVILAIATFLTLGNGLIYMWSIFNVPLMETFGYTASGVALAYSLFMLMSCVGSFLSGWLQQHMEQRFVVLIAGIIFSLGWLLSGFAESLPLLYLFFGGLAGTGNGLSYNALLSVATTWFPDKRGFANGVCTCGGGMGPVIFAPIGNLLIESFDVMIAFRIVGIAWLAIYLLFTWFLVMPRAGWKPSGWNPEEKTATSAVSSQRSFNGREVLKQPLFYVLFLILMVAVTSGQMINGHASSLGQELANLTAAEGALMVSLLGIGSVAGRLGFGVLSDKIGRFTTLIIILGLNAAVMLLFLGNATTFIAFLSCMMIVGACFGGTMSVMPAIVGDSFGSQYFGQNWSFVYPGYTVAAFIGPMVAAKTTEATGSCELALIVAGVLALAGIVLVVIGKRLAKQLVQHQS